MKNKILIAVLTVLSLFAVLRPIAVEADSYSNTDNRKTLSIDKKIRSFSWDYYIDNVSSATKVFYNGNIIEFKIKVTNTGTTNMRNIKVTDKLPPFLKLVFFPGTYNSTDNQVEWTIDELNAGHSQEFLVRAKIDQANEVYTLTQETNVAIASVDEISEKDDAIYYIKAGQVYTVEPPKTIVLPETGSMSLVLETVGAIGVAISGFALRKKVRGY
jgi:uncharacterized repeat protein (TIGR01451 family)/LPXTG-motif cell wall-anchored protein